MEYHAFERRHGCIPMDAVASLAGTTRRHLVLTTQLLRSIVTMGAVAIAAAGLTAHGPQPARATIAQMAWLSGTWSGERGPVTFEERWTPAAGGAMLAVARTLKGGRMVAFEFLRIVERDGGLVYIAQPNGRPPTEFTLTAITPESATFENPAHDFPKVIQYSKRADGTLEARIGDGGTKSQSFVFRRVGAE